ncbi:hypothetical protein NDU88_005327 [Pleurodeles waltl]|uniref:Uncharacterized protein n=1 Tax=Pleurodeles waltl TaxID=8319 RepID=A0AAV7TUF1_PLEWA|nr:hypothetical protein NDU88_005327 [Pleurodeles waltl]
MPRGGARIFKGRPLGLFPSRLVPHTDDWLPGARPTGVTITPGTRQLQGHSIPAPTAPRRLLAAFPPYALGGGARRLRVRPQRLRQVPVPLPTSGIRARSSGTGHPPLQARLGPWGGAAS